MNVLNVLNVLIITIMCKATYKWKWHKKIKHTKRDRGTMRRTQSKGQGGAEEANIREKSNKLKTKTNQTWGTCSRVDGRARPRGQAKAQRERRRKDHLQRRLLDYLAGSREGPGFGGGLVRQGRTGAERLQHQFPFLKSGIDVGSNLLVVLECLRLRTLGSLMKDSPQTLQLLEGSTGTGRPARRSAGMLWELRSSLLLLYYCPHVYSPWSPLYQQPWFWAMTDPMVTVTTARQHDFYMLERRMRIVILEHSRPTTQTTQQQGCGQLDVHTAKHRQRWLKTYL